jgi:hypothetical protein
MDDYFAMKREIKQQKEERRKARRTEEKSLEESASATSAEPTDAGTLLYFLLTRLIDFH